MRTTFMLPGVCIAHAAIAATVELPRERYLDKCRGAWTGQMIGVCYGEPYQFRSNGQPWLGETKPWQPDRVAGALNQDDVYVEQTFLAALEKHGLGITPEQAGKAFAEPEYALYHANKFGRDNIRRGIMPPRSGHPEHNRHADDIDFQIEADVLGLICPGLPHESNRLGEIFGHIMNYGDGVYGGLFIAGMYTEAFFEDRDVEKVLRAGLACIPRESEYHRCITDVITWHKEHPDDWLATWRKIEDKWQDDVDCTPDNPYNIDAKLNGAYVAVGLLYGGGDFMKSLEICIRCGQDADSSTANLGGILGCMQGFAAFRKDLVSGIPAIAERKFSFTPYTFDTLIAATEKVARQVIERTGGRADGDVFHIVRQEPRAPDSLEQWTDQMQLLLLPVTDSEINIWDPAWKPGEVPNDGDGYLPKDYGRKNVLALHPLSRIAPGAIEARLRVPKAEKPVLEIEAATVGQYGPSLLAVYVNNKLAKAVRIETNGDWTVERVDVNPSLGGKRITVRIEGHAAGREMGALYLGTIRFAPQ